MSRLFLTPIDLNKNELRNVRLHVLAAAPSSPVSGILYYNSANNAPYFYNGSGFVSMDVAQVANGYIPLAKLATDPLARANHTGSQTAATISDFDTQVRTSRLDQHAAPTASVSMNSQKLTNLGAPTPGSNDAARIVDVENAVSSAAAGIDSKASVRVVATTNVALSGLQTIDGITLVANDRVLLTGQTTASQNGVYSAQSGAWSRVVDADATGEITPGAFWFVEQGTTYGSTQWRCSNTGTITLGSTSITIVQFGASSTYTNGNGINISGNVISAVVVSGGNLTLTGSGLDVDTSKVPRKVSATIGDNSATAIAVTHNLASLDVIAQVRDAATNAVVDCDIQNTGANVTTFTFSTPPATNSIRVTIVG